jgi:uroporphyrin-3 C-methyltransferase
MKRPGLPLILAVLALIGCAALAFALFRTEQGLSRDLAEKLGEFGATAREARSESGAAQDATRDFAQRLNTIEARLAEFQNQQIALETLYKDLARTRDEWTLADIEQIVTLAAQQLQLSGNVKAALVALETADSRLARLDKPQFTGLRRALGRDMETLRATPFVDTGGIALRLDALSQGVAQLPLAHQARAKQAAPAPAGWGGAARETWNELKQLVQIRRLTDPEAPLLTPTQTYYLRENLRLRLLSARLALLAREEALYQSDLKAAHAWVERYFDARDPTVAAALVSLDKLLASRVSIAVPDIAASLDAVANHRLAHE